MCNSPLEDAHLGSIYCTIRERFGSFNTSSQFYDAMGLTKTELFTENQNEMAAMAKAIAHPARIAILQHLLKANACINGQLVEELGLAQATISQHLKELKAVGLIQGTIEGTAT